MAALEPTVFPAPTAAAVWPRNTPGPLRQLLAAMQQAAGDAAGSRGRGGAEAAYARNDVVARPRPPSTSPHRTARP